MMTNCEFFTLQFYTWEYRGRGFHEEEYTVALEPPFMPFYRHRPRPKVLDEGKRPTWLSKIVDTIKGVEETQSVDKSEALDYESLEAFYDPGIQDKVIFKLQLSRDRKVTPETMRSLLAVLSSTEQKLSFEIIGNKSTITFQLVCSRRDETMLYALLSAYLPCITIQKEIGTEGAILVDNAMTSVISFGLQEEFTRPLLQYPHTKIDPLTAIIGLMDTIEDDIQVGIQVLFQGCVNDWSDSILRSVTDYDGNSFFADAPDAPKLALEKVQSPLFAVSIKAFVQADTQYVRQTMLQDIATTIVRSTKSQSNTLVPFVETDMAQAILHIYVRQTHRTGMLLNTDELASIVHIPSESIHSKKLVKNTRKTTPVPAIAKGKEIILGINTHTSFETLVSITNDDRLKHTHIIGATGTGKSTLIANMILQDIAKGTGITLLDPHGDLVDDIIARIPEHRLQDVVLLDPSDIDFPIGLNILEAHNDVEKEILSTDLVASFKKFATSWGDQMNAVLGNAILAMVESTDGGTLHDLRRFLIEWEYRREFLKSVSDPTVRYYWLKEYPLLKSSSIGSILTRLDTFLRPKVIRNMLIQKKGLDFAQILNSDKILLVKLSQGLIGKENSYLLGSLIVSKLHQAILARQRLQIRTPYFIYIDEFQNFITPSISEMLSGIRKYNVGLILSHQDLQQLQREDTELVNSVLGNIYTRIVFRVGEPDAKKLQDGFADFDYTDLQNLGRGEAVIRIEQPKYNTSLTTIPLSNIEVLTKERKQQIVIDHTRNRYAKPKDEVERELLETLHLDIPVEEKKGSKKAEVIPVEKEIEDEVLIPSPDISQQISNKEIAHEPLPKERDVSTHRYLQTLVKKMAEAKGYVATIESMIPYTSEQVDVLLAKDNRTIAIEICNTTDAEWEVHNIQKCITAGFDEIISLSGDPKQLERIKKKCIENMVDFTKHTILFFTPDVLFEYLNQEPIIQDAPPQQTTMKGYRVSVSYDAITQDEMKRKRSSVAQVVMSSLRKQKKY